MSTKDEVAACYVLKYNISTSENASAENVENDVGYSMQTILIITA